MPRMASPGRFEGANLEDSRATMAKMEAQAVAGTATVSAARMRSRHMPSSGLVSRRGRRMSLKGIVPGIIMQE